MTFDLASAPKVFQQVMTHLLHNIDGTECSMNDILIHTSTKAELEDNSKKVILKLKQAALKLNATIYPPPPGAVGERCGLAWEHDQDSALETLKICLKLPPVLTYYDYNKPVTLSVDARSHSVASVLLQENQPIACVQSTYQNSAELEAFAILTACKKSHQCIWGNNHLHIESDHKPLKVIFKKPLLDALARLQRILF
ncbi:hypothetical protein PR048_025536 [Dryococelus australis]|uniref:Reverse transcriptase/retrotransposon-derived protein RNase H-like domain-containing protein n=1 Tax=Dryococelus australis TaxID=614101 RepID=A0ABQ9GRM0_9NEOP|nr:hypothetical protein PR048_025536 [Dryococelus australis]